jgi:hypothetical protein
MKLDKAKLDATVYTFLQGKRWPDLTTISTDEVISAICRSASVDSREAVYESLRRLRRDGKVSFMMGTWGISPKL